MFKTKSSKISLLLAIIFAAFSYYMYSDIPSPIEVFGRIEQPSEVDYLSPKNLTVYVSALASFILLFNSVKDRGLKRKELELKERELDHKYGKQK